MRFDGSRLRELRLERCWDQHRLAEEARRHAVGVTQSQISRYENGHEPSGRNAMALAHALNVDVVDLYGGAPEADDEDEEAAALPIKSTAMDEYLRALVREAVRDEVSKL